MKNPLNSHLLQFIKKHKLVGKKILLAVSTGVDSMALLALIHGINKVLCLQISIVHVHHGWRAQSDEEFSFLKGYASALGYPFFGKRLELNIQCSNSENIARDARYQFFSEIYQKTGAKGLFIAQHKQDLEETIVKRLYEGAHLLHLGGIKEHDYREGMHIYRPLLGVNKQDLYNLATSQNVPYFEDDSNGDIRFLRTRLRKQFFPILEDVFGKKRGECLVNLSFESQQMEDFFNQKFENEVWVTHPFALNQVIWFPKSYHFFEFFNLLLVFFKKQGFVVSRDIHKQMTEALEGSVHPKCFKFKTSVLFVSKRFCLVLNEDNKGFSKDDGSQLSKACWLYKKEPSLVFEKLPEWFYNKIPTFRDKNISFLNHYCSFNNVDNYIALI